MNPLTTLRARRDERRHEDVEAAPAPLDDILAPYHGAARPSRSPRPAGQDHRLLAELRRRASGAQRPAEPRW